MPSNSPKYEEIINENIYIYEKEKHTRKCFVSFFFRTGNPALAPSMINEFYRTASFSALSLPHPLQTTKN